MTIARGPRRRGKIRSMVRAGASRLRPFIERRRSGRRKSTAVGCNLGTVVDLSSGGMRIRCRRLMHDVHPVELWTERTRVRVRAKVCWAKKIAFRKYELGFQFVDLTPQMSAELVNLSLEQRAGR